MGECIYLCYACDYQSSQALYQSKNNLMIVHKFTIVLKKSPLNLSPTWSHSSETENTIIKVFFFFLQMETSVLEI